MQTSSSFSEILKVAPHAPLDCIHCPSTETCSIISSSPNIQWKIDTEENWLLHIECQTCGVTWSICRRCKTFRTIFRNKTAIVNHRFRYHKRKVPSIRNDANEDRGSLVNVENNLAASNISVTNNANTIDKTLDTNEDHMTNDVSLPSNDLLKEKDNIETNNDIVMNDVVMYDQTILDYMLQNTMVHQLNEKTAYYYAYDVQSNGNGNKYVVAKAIGIDETHYCEINNDEVKFHLHMSKFVSSLTDKQQRGFSSVLSQLISLYIHKKDDNNYIPVSNIPCTKADLDRIYTRSQASISKNLPIPNCKMLKHHSYVSLLDCVADFLMNNQYSLADLDCWKDCVQDTPENSTSKLFFGNYHCNQIIKKLGKRKDTCSLNLPYPVLPIFIVFWSDAFDPNRSNKSNRQSVWIKTCTIKCLSQDGELVQSTYPISVSNKECDHEELEIEIKKDLVSLSEGDFLLMYSRYHKSPVYVHADLFTYKMDQPERRTNLRLLAGNSNTHGRFGYLADLKNKVNVVKSCENCTRSIIKEYEEDHVSENGWRSKKCQKCTAWMYNIDSELLDYNADDDYPQECYDRNGKLMVKKLSFKYLTDVIDKANSMIINEQWTFTKAKSYLKFNGFNSSSIELILNAAVRIRNHGKAEKLKEEDPETWEQILEELVANPELFEMLKRPAVWYQYDDFDCFTDIPMHLLFLGIVKSIILEVMVWLKKRLQHTLFCKIITGLLDEIRLFNLTWCKVLPYSDGQFGGWVSENWLGLCRLCNWFFSMLEYLPKRKLYNDPETEHTKWTMKENKAWLGARGIKAVGNAAEVRKQVKSYFDSNNIPPISANDLCSTETVLKLFNAMNVMISYCMTATGDDKQANELEGIVRYFLCIYEEFNTSINTAPFPGWVTSYNFLSLLNLPSLLKRYGSMRVLWEGGEDGEGYLRAVKPLLRGGLVRQWQVWLMNNLLEDKTFSSIIKNDITNINDSREELTEYKIYGSKKKITEQYNACKPISGFVMKNNKNKLYVAYRHKGKICAVRMKVMYDNIYHRNYMDYRKIEITKQFTIINKDDNCKRMGVLLLPMFPMDYDSDTPLDNMDSKTVTFTVVASDWNYAF